MAKTKKKIVRREWTKEDVRQMKSMAKARSGSANIKGAETNSGRNAGHGCEAWYIIVDALLK